jgi:hypothetical protein
MENRGGGGAVRLSIRPCCDPELMLCVSATKCRDKTVSYRVIRRKATNIN